MENVRPNRETEDYRQSFIFLWYSKYMFQAKESHGIRLFMLIIKNVKGKISANMKKDIREIQGLKEFHELFQEKLV